MDAEWVMFPTRPSHVLAHMELELKLNGRGEEASEEAEEEWDEASMTRFYGASDSTARALLKYLADPDREGQNVTIVEVARALDVDRQAVAGVVGPLKKRAKASGHPSPIRSVVASRKTDEGRRVMRRYLLMESDVAELIREVATKPILVKRRATAASQRG